MRSFSVAPLPPHWIAIGLGSALLTLSGCPSVDLPDLTSSTTDSTGPDPTTSSGPVDPTPGSTTTTPADSSTTTPADSGTTTPTATSESSDSSDSGSTGSSSSSSSSSSSDSSSDSGSSSSSSDGGTTDSGTTGTGSSSDGMESSSDGVAFIVPVFDLGPAIECDLWVQDCPAGTKCMPWDDTGGLDTWNATTCAPVDAVTVGTGGVCQVVGSGTSGIDNCEVGSLCWDIDAATLEGTCVEMCTNTPVAPICGPPDTSCAIANNGLLILCLPGCDPLLQNCDPGEACYPIMDSFTCAPDASGVDGVDGDTCAFINVCDPGLACINSGALDGCGAAVGCCSPFCDVTLGDTCPGIEECVPWFDMGMAPPGFDDVGVCALP